MSEPSPCPVCGRELPRRTTGRPATYCSTSCRQAAHRAKMRARAAAQHAVWLRASMVRDLDNVMVALAEVRDELDEPLAEAERARLATVAAGGEDWHAAPPTGWEARPGDLAATARRLVDDVAGHLREHRRSAVEHAQAVPVAGIRRAPAPSLEPDETLPGNVADTAAEDLAAKPDGVDRDAVFEAVEDLRWAVDVTTASGSRLPDAIAEAIAAPAARLVEAWAAQSGDGPLGELAVAALAVVDAARPHVASWPPTFAATAAGAESALVPVVGIRRAPAASSRTDETPPRDVADTVTAPAPARPATRHRAPVKRLHADGSECTHRISSSGKPHPGQGCPGPARYSATCQADGCDWTKSAGLRVVVEDAKRIHLHNR